MGMNDSGIANGYLANLRRQIEIDKYINSLKNDITNYPLYGESFDKSRGNQLIENCKIIYRLNLTEYEKIRLIGDEIAKYFDDYRKNHTDIRYERDSYGRLKTDEPLGKCEIPFLHFDGNELLQRLLVIYQLDLPDMLINILLGEEVIKNIERGNL